MKNGFYLCYRAAGQPKNGEPRMLPIYQSTTFRYETSEEMGDLFDLKKGRIFSIPGCRTPPAIRWAAKICELEGGAAAMLTSSGQAATLMAVMNICQAGDHVICSAKCYGGTSNLLTVTLKRFGLEGDPGGSGRAGREAGGGLPAQYKGRICRDNFQSGRRDPGY